MVKTIFKLLLATVLFTVLFTVANAVLPFSQGFKELGSSGGNPTDLLFLLLTCAWTCFAIYFVVRHASGSGIKLFLTVSLVIFFVQYFMTQIETWFFGGAFTALTKPDILLLMLAGLFPTFGASALLVKFFQNKNAVPVDTAIYKTDSKDLFIRLGVIGVIYLCVYMLFGYFVAWQFESLRLFYTGSAEQPGFWGQLANNMRTSPIIYPFQIFRGILFGAAIIPIRNMVTKNKLVFVVSVCLIYLCAGIVLLIPQPLFPDTVRLAHLLEMSTSMLLFGIIVGNIMWGKKRNEK
jgi:hypothetical protein